MALKKTEMIAMLGQEVEVYYRIERLISKDKGVYSALVSKYVMIEDVLAEEALDIMNMRKIVVDIEAPTMSQVYEAIKATDSELMDC